MAEKKSQKSSKSSYNKLMDALSFIAVCVGGIALLVAFILGKLGISASIVGILQMIANIIGWIVLCLLSANYIKNKRKIWLWVIWAVAAVMIVIVTILGAL